jgi:hypothetical protein
MADRLSKLATVPLSSMVRSGQLNPQLTCFGQARMTFMLRLPLEGWDEVT